MATKSVKKSEICHIDRGHGGAAKLISNIGDDLDGNKEQDTH